uniref:DNA helicase n=1 Tax=Dermatophagoides pteronyssinus TaxID=6956 RepID=A0A6P6XR66_DERPT|nr:DNA-binding protein SMUBP-2-like isoform X2 [Dermatophagoides pteronyssinus]
MMKNWNETSGELRSKHSLKQLEKSGHAVRKLMVTNQRTAFAKKVIQFSVRPEKRDFVNLINSGMSHGDIVGVTTQEQTSALCTGVVLQVKRLTCEIAFNTDTTMFEEENDKFFNLIQLTNDITYRRIKYALENLYERSLRNYLVSLLFGNNPLLDPLTVLPPYTNDLPYPLAGQSNIIWFNTNLNYSQKNAIEFALYQRHIAVIHGPPGTGKTTTLTELILQMITRGLRVLVCAPSNVAVDNIFKQLIHSSQKNICARYRLKRSFNFVRMGHPARMDSEIQPYSLDSIVMNEGADVLGDLKNEINQIKLETKQNRYTRGQIRERMKEFDQMEEKVSKQKLREAHVIMSTCNGAVMNGQLRYLYDDLNTFSFDVVIIDECAQALEASTWIPLSYAKKCVLGGDHKQLPATICSQEAEKQGLGISLIERVVDQFRDCPDKVVRMLTVQYRMNGLIMNWPSSFFYENRLEADDCVVDRRLKLKNLDEPLPVIRLIDTVGCSMYELESDQQSLSKGNIYEVKLVCIVIKDLLDNGLSPADIGVISPYRLQTSLIEAGCRRMYPESITDQLEINSVDAFQGREKEVIILSLVRSNDEGTIGFLIEERRLNVAITRSRSHLVVVCDSGTVTRNSTALEKFIDYCYEYGKAESASDYQELMDQIEMDHIPQVVSSNSQQAVGIQSNKNKDLKKNPKSNRKQDNNNKNKKKQNNSKRDVHTKSNISINKDKQSLNNDQDEQLFKQLEEFTKNSLINELRFPETLNSGQRFRLYERCEKLNLLHETKILDANTDPPRKQVIVRRPL